MNEIAVIGGGLTGTLLAIFLARHGYQIDVFERLPDARREQNESMRSINLAVSTRGWLALEKAGIGDSIKEISVPMKGRMIHDLSGRLTFQQYSSLDKVIYSVSRRALNNELLTQADQFSNLKIRFNETCALANLDSGELFIENNLPNQNVSGKPYYYTYILKGGGNEIWQPKFTYYGFRYALIEGAAPDTANNKVLPSVLNLTLMHKRNSSPATGTFSCSDTLFNKVNALIQWAIRSNLQSIITDCPHREKLGWIEQDYLIGTSIQYYYDVHLLYKKLIKDMMDAQTTEGLVPDIAPEFVTFKEGFRDSPEWGSAAVILPWLLYKWYGDKQPMQEAYSMMKRYIAYLNSRSINHILSYGLGDWYDYGPRFPGYAQPTPVALTATAIFFYDVSVLGKMAGLMNDVPEQQRLGELADQIKIAFNQKFFNKQTKLYSTGSQTAMDMPYCVGLVDGEYKPLVLNNLIGSIKKGGWKLTAGDIGFHFLVEALDDGGASGMIYEMNHRDDVPGYGYQLKKGATSLTESWAALKEVSNNHLMLGHIMEWFYSSLAGISQQENSIGYKHIKIRPQLVGDMASAKGIFQSPYGLITSEWKKENNAFSLHVTIPVNTNATIYLPVTGKSKIYESGKLFSEKQIKINDNKAVINIGSGEYRFKVY